MRKVAIFILSLPFLALAIAWVPAGILVSIVAIPIWGTMGLIAMLRGEDAEFGLFLMVPLIGPAMYLEITGFCPRLLSAIEKI